MMDRRENTVSFHLGGRCPYVEPSDAAENGASAKCGGMGGTEGNEMPEHTFDESNIT